MQPTNTLPSNHPLSSSPQLHSVHYTLFLPLLQGHFLPLSSLPQHVHLPQMISCGLPTACSSPQHFSNTALNHGAHPSGTAPALPPQAAAPPAPPWAAPYSLQLPPGPVPAGALCGLRLLQAPSTAALWAPAWLHVEICSLWCPWAAGDSLILHGPLLGCSELLLCTWSTS